MTNPPLTLTLTTDELLAVLQVMGTSSMNGLGEPLAGLSEGEQAARLNAGAETLLNRGLCRIEGDQLIMDDMMVAFVGTSLIPDATLLISVVQPDRSNDPHYFNVTEHIAVEHQSPRPGVHVFLHMPDAATLISRVETLLAPVAMDTSRMAYSETWTIPDPQLNEVLVAAQTRRSSEVRNILSRHGWSGEALELLATDLATAPSWVGMVGWGLREPQPDGGTSVILYAGQQRNWLFTPVTDNPEQLTVRNPSGPGSVAAFTDMVAPLQVFIT
jgi:hypothetical protein